MKNKLLDCTLRDGGHVNEFKFGKEKIKKLIEGLVNSGMDYVELGFLKNGNFSEDQTLYNDVEKIYPLLPKKNEHTKYTVMIRPDWYDIKQLSQANGKIEVIRFAFYYKDIELLKSQIKIASKLGYRYICNPVNVMGYSKEQLIVLVKEMNELHPEQFTLVDTYGAIKKDNLHEIYGIVEKHLDSSIRIGLHLHENQALSFSLAQEFLDIKEKNRETAIDASLLGMGRIPGNLCMELIASYMNQKYPDKYNTDILFELIGRYIEPIKQEILWGYSPAYYITAINNMHRSYAEYLLEKGDLKLGEINHILKGIEKKMRSEFHKDYIQEKYSNYMGEKSEKAAQKWGKNEK